MVDLFGKRKLEDRILELEAALAKLEGERDDLSRTLDKRDEKIRKLSGSLQEANLALKAAEQKAALSSSQATVAPPVAGPEREEGREEKAHAPSGRRMDPRQMARLMERLSAISSAREDLLTVYLSGPAPVDMPLPDRLRDAAAAIGSPRGTIILHCPDLFSLLLVPPFLVGESRFEEAATFILDPLREMLETPVLVLSAHAGDSFLGVALSGEGFEEEMLLKSPVIGKHSKGGWSQKRFERLREEEIKNHADQVIEAFAALTEKYAPVVRYAVLAGEEGLLRRIAPTVRIPALERRLAGHNEKDLKALLDEVYGFVIYRRE